MLLVMVLHPIFSQFDLNFLIPHIIGRSVRLPPMVVILGIVAGASIAGVLGIILAAPSIASLHVLGRYSMPCWSVGPLPRPACLCPPSAARPEVVEAQAETVSKPPSTG